MNAPSPLGCPTVDRQHADLHVSLQRLRRLLDKGAPAADVSDELSRLSKKICEHFADEERSMRMFAVPVDEALAHVKDHDRILHELVSIHEAEMKGDRPGLSHLCAMAEEWIVRHLEEFDQDLVSYFSA